MSTGSSPAVTDARPVTLVRYRPGVVGETARTVHLIPLPVGGSGGAVTALCGASLSCGDIELVTGTLLLPPTVTTRGPITWTQLPEPDALRLCREIDVLAALRTALNDPPTPH